ncbi:Major facilitator superfamily protein isoform 4 [Theobroma cacao]|uniref:Major facilitator superfamily protein isoform 4 n=1 Tax=Theobroma cacao TaxID=3641 RepID=A0A061DH97_THECC|nr:Major facilitator superfamily protein isoform 4 [Theobroma cacao]
MASPSPSSTLPKEEEKESSAQQSNAQPEAMARSSSTKDPPPAPSWFTPKRLLIIFCVINMINYVDRGAIASNGVNGSARSCDDKGICTSGSGIQGEFQLTNFEDGLLSSAFMVGLLVASPIFASLAKSHNPFRLIGVGLSVWTLAAAGCGSAFSFWFIAICRMLVGVGEASFISLAAPFIDDNAPASQKTAWLAMFYMCIPSGVALGYVYGGFVGGHFNWRYAFWGEALLMLPFAVFGFVVKPLQLKGFAHVESKKALTSVETVSAVNDDSEASKVDGRSLVGRDGISADDLNTPCKLGELLVFATQAPVNYVCLHCVKPSLRPLSMAISTVSIHIFGDVPSSPLVGVLQDHVNNWRETALILTSILFLAAGIWFIGVFLHGVDKSNDESESQVSANAVANRKPLLDGNEDESPCEV